MYPTPPMHPVVKPVVKRGTVAASLVAADAKNSSTRLGAKNYHGGPAEPIMVLKLIRTKNVNDLYRIEYLYYQRGQ